MQRKIIYPILILLFASFLYSQNMTPPECFMLMVGKKASADGSVMIAHNNDLTGSEASLLEMVDSTVTADSLYFSTGLKIPAFKHNYKMLILRIVEGFSEGDAVAINENMVAIGGGVALGGDRDSITASSDTLISKGLTGGVRYHALRNVKSAREYVSLIGSLYTKYGVSYPSGISIADTSEIWYLESGGGKMWAAVRVPDDACMVVTNGYRIGKISFNDRNNFITSPGLPDFCRNNKLVDSMATTINFADIFGRGRENRTYDTRRVWRGISLLNDSLNFSPDDKTFPMFIKPKQKLTPAKLFSILRDQYENTPYSPDSVKGERLICSSKTVHSDVIQLKANELNDIGVVLWTGLSNPKYTVYLPFYFGINEIPFAYKKGGYTFDARSAFWSFKDLGEKIEKMDSKHQKSITAKLRTFENRIIRSQEKTLGKYQQFRGRDPKTAADFLTKYLESLSESTMKIVKIITSDLEKVIK